MECRTKSMISGAVMTEHPTAPGSYREMSSSRSSVDASLAITCVVMPSPHSSAETQAVEITLGTGEEVAQGG